MSNYIKFSIKVNNCSNNERKSFIKDLALLADIILEQKGDNEYSTYDVWNNYIKDLCLISKKYSNAIVTVDCNSDDDDIWRVYFVNGKYQIVNATIVYEEFDPLELTDYEDE